MRGFIAGGMAALTLTACARPAGTGDPPGGGPATEEPTSDLPTDPTSEPTGPARCAERLVVEGEPALQGRPAVTVPPASCTTGVHATAGAAGSRLAVRVDADRAVVVTAADVVGNVLLDATLLPPHAAAPIWLDLVASGEVLVTIAADDDLAEPLGWRVETACLEGCDLPFTRYPIVLMHGMSGSDTLFGMDYFYGVPDAYAAAGVTAFVTRVAPFSDSAGRAAEVELDLDGILDLGHRKVNLIGHSQGGLDARTLASPAGRDRGDVIASVTTVGTPHRGSPVADLVLGAFDSGLLSEDWIAPVVGLYVDVLGLQADDPEFVASLEQLSEETLAAADPLLVDAPGTWYGSWVGRSCGILEPVCIANNGGEVVDVILGASYLLIWPRPSDGLVPLDSQTHGVVLGELPADHLDEVGQIADTSTEPFDHLGFYLAEVDRLEALGF